MKRDIVVKSRSLGGSSDLTLLAPIKPGFVESLESITYKTRIKRVLETLHGARSMAHEHHTARLLSDSVERVGAIQSVRVAVLEPEDKVLLAVTFEGSWESYIRVLWDKVGTLLDLIFCGTVDYVTAHDHTFEEWLVWARRVQVETGFFYGPADSTARDLLYHRRVERMTVRGAAEEPQKPQPSLEQLQLRAVLPSAEDLVDRVVHPPKPPLPDDTPIIPTGDYQRLFRERIRSGLQGLAGIYRLTDLHRPGTPDGEVLRRAAIDLLLEFIDLWEGDLIRDQIREAREGRFPRQLDWLFPDGKPKRNKRPRPPRAEEGPEKVPDAILGDIQGGIVRSYPRVTHGVILMVGFRNAAAARDLLEWLRGRVTSGAHEAESSAASPFCNVSFTPAGLRTLGMDEANLELFPEAFRQGMAARCGLIGDVRNNHPRRWRLPRRFTPGGGAAEHQRIEIDTVHAVIQFDCRAAGVPIDTGMDLTDAAHPLRNATNALRQANPGIEVLAVQPLVRRFRSGPPGRVREHFGYVDGIGQPDVEAGKRPNDANRVHLGEIICGHENAADFRPDPNDPSLPAEEKARLRWLGNGSFLVMRKYRQFVHRLEKAVEAAAGEIVRAFPDDKLDIKECREIVYAKLMGRNREGVPLVRNSVTNAFNYKSDAQGEKCPLHAHIRLANPRVEKDSVARFPRIMRRGMSFGPAHTPGADDEEQERGVLFMAYNASISEQYEVIQRWLTGGNSTGSSSGPGCPIVGVPENGFPRYFRFEYREKLFRVALENGTPIFEEPEVLARLEWGVYLFTPSLSALERLHALAAAAAAKAPAAEVPWQTPRGRQLLKELEQLRLQQGAEAAAEAWKNAIEDPQAIDRLESAALWAAIREDHGGVFKTRTPYGTLVANRDLVSQVLLNAHERYSICGQFERMQASIGEIYLGRDAGPRYWAESTPINEAATALAATPAGKQRVFEVAFNAARKKIAAIIDEAKCQSAKVSDVRFEVGFEAREVVDEVLADLCEAWFGLQGSPHLQRGGSDWAWTEGKPPLYPGHFTALSRYMFQPSPGPLPTELGQRYGVALRGAMKKFVDDHRAAGTTPKQPDGSPAPIALAVFGHAQYGNDPQWVARTMAGVMMGFIAPIIGALFNVLREWQREGRFAVLRADLAGRTDRNSAHTVLRDSLTAAAHMRPMPQFVWRTALEGHRLGYGSNGVDIDAGEKIVLGIVSGTQQSLQDGEDDGRLMFGGVRKSNKEEDGRDRSALCRAARALIPCLPARPPSSPTHACPGYEAAIEALLGALTGFLTCDEKLRQGTAPLTFVAEGGPHFVPPPGCLPGEPQTSPPTAPQSSSQPAPQPPPPPVPQIARADQIRVARAAVPAASGLRKPLPQVPGDGNGLVLAVGDSWLDHPYPLRTDLREWLETFGYSVPDDLCSYNDWGTADTLSRNTAEIVTTFTTMIQENDELRPRAVLISSGGNDCTGRVFKNMLNVNDGNPGTRAMDLQKLANHMDGYLKPRYITIIDEIKKKLVRLNIDIPIIVHGYDYSQLNGGIVGSDWFRNPFRDRKWDHVADSQKELDAMVDLIDGFNGMLTALANAQPYKPFVRHVKLTGTTAEYWTVPRDEWLDDLHPTGDPLFVMATKIHAMIKAPYP